MKELDYEKITIESMQNLFERGYIKETICNADNKKIEIIEADYLELEKAIRNIAEAITNTAEAISELVKQVFNAFNNIFKNIKNILNKKITKKRFMKLLQSNAIQRNEINKIIKNNKESYTYLRYYKTLVSLRR